MVLLRVALTVLCLAAVLSLVAAIPYTTSILVVSLIFVAAMVAL